MNGKIQIGNRSIGIGEPTFVIAEIGSNHDQKWDQARELIEKAAEAGADAAKFQLYVAEDLYPAGAPAYGIVKRTELPREWVPRLADYSARYGLMFLATPFSRDAIDRLASVDVPAYKWASSETVNLPLLKYAARKQKPILLSTGMCNLADIFEAVEIVNSEQNKDIILLQCTSLYPTEPRYVHLRAMDTLRSAFQLPVGFSDHTTDIVIPAAAVARGACVIEKHLTINRQLAGPDHGYALEPEEFKRMVEGIRATEQALGSPAKTILPEEIKVARRSSIRAARDIEVGEVLGRELIVVQGPAPGIRPRFLDTVIGCRVLAPIKKGEPMTWEELDC